MTQSGAVGTSELLRQSIIDNFALLQALESYALNLLPKPPSVPDLSPRAQEFLATDAGRNETKRLLLAFRTTMTMLTAYVATLGSDSRDQHDLEEAHDASRRPLIALVERLQSLV